MVVRFIDFFECLPLTFLILFYNMAFVPCPRCAPGSNRPLGHSGAHIQRHSGRHVACQNVDAIVNQRDVSYLGRMDKRCTHCGTCLFEQELCLQGKYGKYSQCCENGAVMPPPFKQPPQVILACKPNSIYLCECHLFFFVFVATRVCAI